MAAYQLLYDDGSVITSLHSKFSTDFTLHNTTPHAAYVCWFRTFLTHPWTVEAADGSEKVLVINNKRVCWNTLDGSAADLARKSEDLWSSSGAAGMLVKEGGSAAAGAEPHPLLPLQAGFAREEPRGKVVSYLWFLSSQLRKGGASKSPRSASGGSNLGSLPLDVILLIIKALAPQMPDILPVPLADQLDISSLFDE